MQSHEECYEDNDGGANSIKIALCLLSGLALMGQWPKMLQTNTFFIFFKKITIMHILSHRNTPIGALDYSP